MIKPGQYLGLGIFGTHAATPDLGVIQEEQLNDGDYEEDESETNKEGDDEDEER